MRFFRYIILFIYTAVLITGCVEPFDPEITKYENILVVDGTITSQEKKHFLTLSRTYNYYADEKMMETGAAVFVMDQSGNMAAYNEIQDGIYMLDPSDFAGQIGHYYKLIIETAAGKHYESSFEQLKRPVDIDSVYYEIKEDITTLDREIYDAIQFYINAEDETNQTHFYRWEWTETWEYYVPYTKPGFENKVTCWSTENSSRIAIASTLNLESDVIFKQKLNTVTSRNSKLSNIYSLIVRQHSLTREAYDFWRKLELSNEHTGSLFDPPPTPVTGNIENTEDPYEPVLGYFQVSGESEKRIFLKRADLPKTFDLTTGNEHCSRLELMGEGIDELQDGWYLINRFNWMDTTWTSMSSHIDCYDCTQKGSNVKPYYWPEDD